MVGQGLGEGWREVCGMMAKLCNGIGVGAGGLRFWTNVCSGILD